MSAHTPGPWELLPLDRDKKYYGTLVKIGNDQLEIWTPGNFGTLRPSAREIANGWEDGYPYDHMESEECLANARLIAAAPDLLEACVESLNALVDYIARIEKTGGSLNYGHHVMRKCYAAIKKADGGE